MYVPGVRSVTVLVVVSASFLCYENAQRILHRHIKLYFSR